MRVASVGSTTLLTVSYDEARARLPLEFCSRAVYPYFHVPAVVHQSLLAIVEENPMARTLAGCHGRQRCTLRRTLGPRISETGC